MKKRIALLIVLLCMIPAYASAELLITTDYGLHGKGKQDRPIAVTITIENDERPFEGDLVATYPNYQLQSGQVIPLKLDANEKITRKIYIGNYPYQLYDNSNEPYVFLYEGDVENNKQYTNYKVVNNKPHLYSYDTRFVGVLNNKEIVKGLQTLRAMGQGSLVEIQNYSVDELLAIEDVRDLSFVDLLVLSEPTKQLSQQQLQLVRDWLQTGGQLIVAGDLAATPLNDIAALQLSDANSVVSIEQLQRFANEGTFNEALKVQNSSIVTGAKQYQIDGVTLAAKQKVGDGALIQTAFSLTDPALLQVDGYAHLLGQMIDLTVPYYYPLSVENELVNTLVPTNELFPAFEFSLWKIIAVFILYILLVGPILYVVLKKKDKREYAWWMIPAISIVFSLVLFVIGARDRIVQPQLQQSAVIKVGEQSEQYFVQSLLSNRSGDYQFELAEGIEAIAYGHEFSGKRDLKKGRWSYVKSNELGQALTLKNVPYWDVETIVGQGPIDIGQFQLQLINENGHLVGTIKNELGIDVENVQIWTGAQLIEIGRLKSGEVMELDEKIDTTILLATVMPHDWSYRTPTPSTIDQERQTRLRVFAQTLIAHEQSPAIIAYSSRIDFGGNLQRDALKASDALIVQPFTAPLQLSDQLTLTEEAFSISYSSELYGSVKGMMLPNEQTLYLDPGEYEVVYQLPKQLLDQPIDWTSLHYKVTGIGVNAEIYNVKNGQFEVFSDSFSTDNVNDYLDQGELRLKWLVNEGIYQEQKELPKVELKGVLMP